MKYIIAGLAGIPIGGFCIAAIYHYWRSGTCIVTVDLTDIKLILKKIQLKWLNNRPKYLASKTQDPVTGDGLLRNIGTSP